MKYYPNLFSPFEIGKITFRNRIFNTPHSSTNYTYGGYATENEIAFFEAKAKGGAAQVSIGETPVDARYLSEYKWTLLNINDICCMTTLSELALAIKLHGAVPSIQLTHPGQHCSPEAMGGRHPIGPMGLTLPNGQIVDEMNEDMIEEAIEAFAKAAAICKQAGFDMCQIHGAHGWLLSQFLSTRINKRKDRWGGSLENRARLPIAVIDRVRERVGKDFLLEYRISGDELTDDGMKIDEVIEFLKIIEDKIDLVHISVGLHDNPRMAEFPQALYRMFPPASFTEHGCNVYLAAAVKKAGIKVPVITVGGITTPELADSIIAEGKADFVGMARQLLADPEFPNKARQGRRDDIIPCLRCDECLIGIGLNSNFACSVNPKMGREFRWQSVPKPEASRKVLVIGGGPGGMQAAITAAERGHDVTLVEKSGTLGGLLKFSDYDPSKDDLKAYKDYLVKKTMSLAKVKLNTEATPELIEKEAADVVIAAVGSDMIVPNIPGVSGQSVMSALDAYYHTEKVGKKVAIIGGGTVGSELGLYLAELGKTVMMVEMKNERYPLKYDSGSGISTYLRDVPEYYIGDPFNYRHMMPLVEKIKKTPNFSYKVGTKCVEITPKGIKVAGKDGKEEFIEADTVIYAVGMKPNSDTVEQLRDSALNFYPIGDCVAPLKIMQATQGGFFTALDIR